MRWLLLCAAKCHNFIKCLFKTTKCYWCVPRNDYTWYLCKKELIHLLAKYDWTLSFKVSSPCFIFAWSLGGLICRCAKKNKNCEGNGEGECAHLISCGWRNQEPEAICLRWEGKCNRNLREQLFHARGGLYMEQVAGGSGWGRCSNNIQWIRTLIQKI